MSPVPTRQSGATVDLSPRVFSTSTVVASPAAAAETIIASLTVNQDLAFGLGVVLIGYAAFTAGTNGVSANLKLRQTDASGSTLKASGLVTVAAASLYDRSIVALDTGPTLPGQVYVMTLTIGSGAAASTVRALSLIALVI